MSTRAPHAPDSEDVEQLGLFATDAVDVPVPYVLTARARRRVAPHTLPDLRVVTPVQPAAASVRRVARGVATAELGLLSAITTVSERIVSIHCANPAHETVARDFLRAAGVARHDVRTAPLGSSRGVRLWVLDATVAAAVREQLSALPWWSAATDAPVLAS